MACESLKFYETFKHSLFIVIVLSQKWKLDVKSNLEDSGLLGYDALLLGGCSLTVHRYFPFATTCNTRLPTHRHIPQQLITQQNSMEI